MFKLISKISKWTLILIGAVIVLGVFALSIVAHVYKPEIKEFFDWFITAPGATEELINIISELQNFFDLHSEVFLISMSIAVGIIFLLGPIAYRINYKKDMRKIHALIGKSNTAVSRVVRSSRL